MTAINHALTGAVIGLVVHDPWIALPAALISHVVCDTIPHFGLGNDWIAKRSFALYLAADALACVLLVAVLFASGHSGWLQGVVCAFLATSPDLLSIRRFVAAKRHRSFHMNGLEAFFKRVQWFERPAGAGVELAWFVAGVVVLSAIL